MRVNKIVRWYITYELAVTGYNFAQAKFLPQLPVIPLPSLLSKLLAGMLGTMNSVAGKQAVYADGTQAALPSDAIVSADGSMITTGGMVYPVLAINQGVYMLDQPTSQAAIARGT